MPTKTAAAEAHPNIAFIKYWGNTDHELRLPANGSISMNLAGLRTKTSVTFDPTLKRDSLTLNGIEVNGPGLKRISLLLDRVRDLSQIEEAATVISDNNFPTGSGIASSASAFAALAVAGSAAAGLTLTESQLSVLARTGSGSASRSIPGGFVEWHAGFDHESSYAESIAPPDHWNLVDLIAIVSTSHKKTGSTGGHGVADTSVLQSARVQDATRRLNACRDALLEKDFSRFASIIEEDSNIMHAIMMTSNPKLIYWEPATVSVMKNVTQWREESGLSAAYTIDAGPNVHVICLADNAVEIESKLRALPGVLDVLKTTPGGPAQLLDS